MITAFIAIVLTVGIFGFVFWAAETVAYTEASINLRKLAKFRKEHPEQWSHKEELWTAFFEKELRKHSRVNVFNEKVDRIFKR